MRLSRRLLTALIVVISVPLVYFLLSHVHWARRSLVMAVIPDFVPLYLPMLVGPLLFLYVRSCLEPDMRFSRMHFYPVIIDLLPFIAGYVLIGMAIGGFFRSYSEGLGRFVEAYRRYLFIPRCISIGLYLLATLRLLLGRLSPS